MEFLKKYQHLSWLLLLVPIYLFIFLKLGNFHVRLWDESWFAVHAYEMLERGSWFVAYFQGQPVHEATKPPLQTWSQFLTISLIGYNELALRLPSAISAAATVLLIFFFLRKEVSEKAAWIGALVLLSSSGFIHFHAARGMEADAMLTFFMTLQVVFFWNWLKHEQAKHLIGLGLTIGVAFWVKSVMAFLFVPGFLVFLLVYKLDLLKSLFRNPSTYIALALAFGLPALLIVIKELTLPGYIDFFLERNAGRYVSDVGHERPFLYYYQVLSRQFYPFWLIFFVLGLLWSLLPKAKAHDAFKLATILTLSYFFVISFSLNKLSWYAVPMYPLMAIVATLPMLRLFELVEVPYPVAVAVAFAIPMHFMFTKTQRNQIELGSIEYEMQEEYLYKASIQSKNVDGLRVAHDHFNGALLFYKYKLKEMGQSIQLQNHVEAEVGDRILANSKLMQNEIKERYETEIVDQMKNAIVYEIKAIKNE